MRCWHSYLSGAKCKWFAYGPADATAIPSSLASLKSEWFCFSDISFPGCPGKEAIKWVLLLLLYLEKYDKRFGC